MPRVVRMIARLNVGGPALHATYLSSGLADRFDTLLVTGVVASDEADLTQFARDRGVRLEVLPRMGREIHPWNDLVVVLQLVRLLRRERPLIVHTHTAKAGTVGRLAAVIAGVPVRVHTFHGHVLRGYFGPLKTRLFIAIERFLARFSTVIVAISESQADELAGEFRICSHEKMRVIPLGLELDRLASTPEDVRTEFRSELGAGDRVVVSCVGRLVPIKNHDLLLDAFAKVIAGGASALLVIVGGGSEEQRLRAKVSDLGIAGHVRFLGWRSDLVRIYAGSDIVALSSDNEGTPVAVIEAMAAGRAVIATDVGGVRDVLEGGRLGSLVPRGDADAFARELAALVSDGDRRRAFAATGANAVVQRFGKARLLRDIETLYDELLASRQARTRMSASQPANNVRSGNT